MNIDNLYWMNYTINIANNTNDSKLHVGAVLVSNHNKLICSAFTNEDGNSSWYNILLSKIRMINLTDVQTLYLTINTLSSDSEFELNKLLRDINISQIYLGIPDPQLTYYSQSDPELTFTQICRYPDNLQRKILQQNHKFYENSKQNIKLSPYYSEKRISNLVIEKLKEKGFTVSKSELNLNKKVEKLSTFIANKYEIEFKDANNLVNRAMSEAFDEKYSSYDYSNDARSVNIDWKKNFISVYNKLLTSSIDAKNILDVGVGSGNEAIALFSNCKNITFVDIAPNGLEKIKKQIPNSNVLLARAENLSSLSDNSYDLYVSLRTYNSSFFDIKQAITEANRVLKHNAVAIVSIANGFLCPEQKSIIPGLIIPGTEFVDIYHGIDMIKDLSIQFSEKGFKNIQIFPTNGEIYLAAISK